MSSNNADEELQSAIVALDKLTDLTMSGREEIEKDMQASMKKIYKQIPWCLFYGGLMLFAFYVGYDNSVISSYILSIVAGSIQCILLVSTLNFMRVEYSKVRDMKMARKAASMIITDMVNFTAELDKKRDSEINS
jgi:hypothetical protein